MRQLAFIVASAQSTKNIFYSRLLLKRPYPPAYHLPRCLTRHLAARRMGRANGSRECAPDDKLRDTHQLHFIDMMGFAGLNPSTNLVICPSGGFLTGLSSLFFGFSEKYLLPLTPNHI